MQWSVITCLVTQSLLELVLQNHTDEIPGADVGKGGHLAHDRESRYVAGVYALKTLRNKEISVL